MDEAQLREMALRYVAKYATTKAKLRQYLARKLRERGWANEVAPDLEGLAEDFARLGLVDDAAYAVAKSRSLSTRGYGKRRVVQQLRHDGVEEADSADAAAHADEVAIEAALRLARRRRIGPFSPQPADRQLREKWIMAMVRAGHGAPLARAIATLPPSQELDLNQLCERLNLVEA